MGAYVDGKGKYVIVEESPTAAELMAIRRAVGWGVPEKRAAEASVKHALYSVCVRVGMAS